MTFCRRLLRHFTQRAWLRNVFNALRRLAAGGLFVAALFGCSSSPTPAPTGFAFKHARPGVPSPTEILALKYGDQQVVPRKDGTRPPIGTTYAELLAGIDHLYAKWRIPQTGEVLEKRVDVATRVPAGMQVRTIFLAIEGRDLILYVQIPPQGKQWAQSRRINLLEIYPGNGLTGAED